MRTIPFLMITGLLLSLTVSFAQVKELPSPAGPGSSLPGLSAAEDGRVFMSWVETGENEEHVLLFSTLSDSGWSPARTVASGTGWFVNWADFPSLIQLSDGSLAAHWLAKSGKGTYAYDVNIVRSRDSGRTWSEPVTPHRDGTETEHGFVSLFQARTGDLGAVWLDGREMGTGNHGEADENMTLRYASLGGDGIPSDTALLDDRVCECCQTSVAMTTEGPIIVYRDRSQDEIRDISTVRWENGIWSRPRSVSNDHWEIDGCPVNGPAVDAKGTQVAVAWFTAAGDTPRVKVTFSGNAGKSFGESFILDDGSPSGRVDIVLMGDGTALVSWLENEPDGGSIRLRQVWPDGRRGKSLKVTPSGTARSSGFPRMVHAGGVLVFAWTGDRVHTAIIDIP